MSTGKESRRQRRKRKKARERAIQLGEPPKLPRGRPRSPAVKVPPPSAEWAPEEWLFMQLYLGIDDTCRPVRPVEAAKLAWPELKNPSDKWQRTVAKPYVAQWLKSYRAAEVAELRITRASILQRMEELRGECQAEAERQRNSISGGEGGESAYAAGDPTKAMRLEYDILCRQSRMLGLDEPIKVVVEQKSVHEEIVRVELALEQSVRAVTGEKNVR